jgi:hypothetical protein
LLQYGEYAAAEKVFRDEILRRPRNGRALFGLAESLRKQGKEGAAKSVQGERRPGNMQTRSSAWNHYRALPTIVAAVKPVIKAGATD